MASDAHAHPYDLLERRPDAETLRRAAGVACAASAWREEEFLYHEGLAAAASADGAAPMLCCFGVHPQLPAVDGGAVAASRAFLGQAAEAGRLAALGEIGFDLFDAGYRATEALQDRLFDEQLDLALEFRLPVVLHLRRAMHKVFAHSARLRRLPSLILHSYSGTLREALGLLDRGLPCFFSFGTTVALNHRKAMEACAALPLETLLVETDAPYQPLRGRSYSSWEDLEAVIATVAALRAAAGNAGAEVPELDAATDGNFRRAYGLG